MVRFLLLCLICASATEYVSAQIVGRWRSLETSRGGLGVMYEFHADGTVEYSPGAVVEMPWRIEASELVFPAATVEGPDQRTTMKWIAPNKLSLVDHGVTTAELTRVGSSSDSSNTVLGEWTGMRDMAGRKLEMRWFFYAGGKSLFLMPFLTQHGRYTTKSKTLSIQMQDKSPTDVRFEMNDESLTVMKVDGSDKLLLARY